MGQCKNATEAEAAKHGPDMDEKMKADMSQEYSMGANRHEP
jgi:hypothetical protein